MSINDFTSEDIQAAQKWAYKFYKELGNKSPFFRAWFGDWMAYDQNTIRNFIAVNTSKITPQDVSRIGADNADTGWHIDVSGKGIDETAFKRGKWSKEYHSLASINDMLENAILLDTVVVNEPSKNMGESTAFVHHLYCPVSVDGVKAIAKIYVTEELGNRNMFYLTKIETVSTDSIGLGSRSTLLSSVDTANWSVSQIFDFVKKNNDKFEADSDNPTKFEPKPVNPVLLDENKNPKVFYHGTNERFTVFSPDELNPREGSYFFAENIEDARGYGENVYEVYLSAEKLADYDNQPSEFYKLKSKREQVEYLKAKGYDGWYSDMDSGGWGEVSVFSNTQIKSATDNVGTFDGSNPDIQYSRKTGRSSVYHAYEIMDMLGIKHNPKNRNAIAGTLEQLIGAVQLGGDAMTDENIRKKFHKPIDFFIFLML